jgi:hypothetical protein
MIRPMFRCALVPMMLAASVACKSTATQPPQSKPTPPAASKPSQPVPVPTPPPIPPAGAPAGAQDPADQKLDAALRELAKADSDTALETWAAKHQVKTVGKKVPVDVTCKDASAVPSVVAALKAAGAEINTTFQNKIYASIPADGIRKAAALADVWSMALSRPTVRPGR